MMRTSIATVSLSGALIDKIAAAAKAGFDAVEIFENDLLSAPQSAREIRDIIADHGLQCAMYQPFRDYEGLPTDARDRATERMRRKFATMEELGTDLILLCSNCSPDASGDRARMLDDLGMLAEVAAAHNNRIAYEALAWGLHVHDHRDAWALVRDVNHPALGLCLDSFHSLSREVPSASIGDIRGEKLFIVQMADAPKLAMDHLNWSRHFRCMPGQGNFALAEYAAAIHRIGYDGYWSLEIFNDRFRATSASQVARDGMRGFRFMGDQARIVTSAETALPPAIAPKGVAFVEFAAAQEDAAHFETVFAALGFAHVANHRSKDVRLWQQGDCRLVVNCEPDGLANSFDMVHGASVCAIGLTVDDQSAVLNRARGLGVSQYSGAVADGEWEIPSLRGVGGSLLYLVDGDSSDAMWAAEFPNAKPAPDGPLTRVDHLAQTMQYEEFLSWLLYYTSVFAMEKTPQLEIADPMGLVYSQAVETADRALRITLNGSMAANALSTRFVQHYMGAGVQHIAFACDDIFAAAARAKDAGLPFLDIGPNYYTDLEARFDLAPETVARMRDLNILYDRDAQGEYFQFYSRAVAKRVFFEVVQRVGYDAYGAVNASIRLNAQSAFRDPAGL